MEFPKLVSSREAAVMMGIDPKNMSHRRKQATFPQPFMVVDKFPLWKESDIMEWMENRIKSGVGEIIESKYQVYIKNCERLGFAPNTKKKWLELELKP